MAKQHAPFRYDYVGSFLRPEKLKEARKALEEGKITAEELKAVEDEAIRDLVKKQKEAGYYVITDGEFRRSTWHLDFMWRGTPIPKTKRRNCSASSQEPFLKKWSALSPSTDNPAPPTSPSLSVVHSGQRSMEKPRIRAASHSCLQFRATVPVQQHRVPPFSRRATAPIGTRMFPLPL